MYGGVLAIPLCCAKPPSSSSSSSSCNDSIENISKAKKGWSGSRRELGYGVLSLSLSLSLHLISAPHHHPLLIGVEKANAAGLLQMPPFKLNNRYFLVRSGESQFEQLGIINTNPVAKTSMDNGLSEEGKKQAVKSALELQEMGACDGNCWIWPSITQRAYQSAEIIAYVNGINRSRIVPEYSFLDARGLGAYEGKDAKLLDEVYVADSESPNTRPPPFTDGTPNESVADVLVRVTQLMSVLETQYFGETVVIVAPDSDNLSVLQAALTGLDLRRHNSLAFAPGEVRFVDNSSMPAARKPPMTGLIKCYKPPNCT